MKVRLQHSRRSEHKRRIQIVVISFSVILIGWMLPSFISAVSAVVFYPVHATNKWLNESADFVPELFRDRKDLVAEIEKLESDLLAAHRFDLTEKRLFLENNRLRQLMGAEESARIAAAVIARPNELPYDLLQIDRGSRHGIEVGAPVFVGEDVVVGLVVHTAEEYSFVELFTTSDFEASAFVLGPDVVANLEGLGGGVARVRVPQGLPLRIGDLVVLPSIEPGVFGRITYIENEPTQPEQLGYITPDLAISSMHLVSVGKLSQISQSTEVIQDSIREEIERMLFIPELSTPSSSDASSTEAIIEQVQ